VETFSMGDHGIVSRYDRDAFGNVMTDARTTLFAVYGRTGSSDPTDGEAARRRQFERARALIEQRGGRIVAEFFDVGQSRSTGWARRPQAAALLNAVKTADRGFEAIVVTEADPARHLRSLLPLLERHQAAAWLPEIGGPIDSADVRHHLILSALAGIGMTGGQES
jgi:site-specific DNA recombinase